MFGIWWPGCKIFTFSTSSLLDPLVEFQPNLVLIFFEWRQFKLLHALLQWEKLKNWHKSSTPELLGPMSSKLGRKYPWVKRIQCCLQAKGNISPLVLVEMTKKHWRLWNISQEPQCQLSAKLGRNFLEWGWFKFVQMKGYTLFQVEILNADIWNMESTYNHILVIFRSLIQNH